MKPARQPWHYDATNGRPQWSKDLGRHFAKRRQIENDLRKRVERQGARR